MSGRPMLKQTFRTILFRGRKTTYITKQLFHKTFSCVGDFTGHLRENESRSNDGNVNNALKNFKFQNSHTETTQRCFHVTVTTFHIATARIITILYEL